MHVGGICVFEGHVPREAVVQRVRERVHLIPRYAMRLDEAPLGLANPAWIDDETFAVTCNLSGTLKVLDRDLGD